MDIGTPLPKAPNAPSASRKASIIAAVLAAVLTIGLLIALGVKAYRDRQSRMAFEEQAYESEVIDDVPDEAPEEVPDEGGWAPFTVLEGGFTVEFPGEPTHEQSELTSDDGVTFRSDTYSSWSDATQNMYFVNFMRHDSVDKSFDADGLRVVLDSIVTSDVNNELIFSEPTSYQGRPALDFSMRNSGGLLQSRLILSDGDIIQLMSVAEEARVDQARYDAFLNSLTFL